jgi:hypothetical protein
MQKVFLPAYMTFKFYDNLTSTYPFKSHILPISSSLAFFSKKKLSGSNDFYVVNLKIAFQGGTGSDLDPFNDISSAKLGLTSPFFSRERSLLFAETIKDAIVNQIANTDIEIGAIASHEIMHLMRNNGTHDDTGLGASQHTSQNVFSDAAIYEIRKNSKR